MTIRVLTIFLLVIGVFVNLFFLYRPVDSTGGDKSVGNKLGGFHDVEGNHNSVEIDSLARFAVEEHNKKANSVLEFLRVLKAREQVVAGKLYHLTVEASDAGKKRIYEAKVWVKPWMNFKQLNEFKHLPDVAEA